MLGGGGNGTGTLDLLGRGASTSIISSLSLSLSSRLARFRAGCLFVAGGERLGIGMDGPPAKGRAGPDEDGRTGPEDEDTIGPAETGFCGGTGCAAQWPAGALLLSALSLSLLPPLPLHSFSILNDSLLSYLMILFPICIN